MKTSFILTIALSALACFGCSPVGGSGDATPSPWATPANQAPSAALPAARPLPPGAVVRFGPTDANATTRFCGDHLPAPTRPHVLFAKFRKQDTDKWCALGVGQTVAEFYGLTVRQCRLADQRDGFAEGTCCAMPTSPSCNHGTSLESEMAMLSAMGLYGYAVPGAVSEDELIEELGNGRMVLFGEVSSDAAHAIAITGYDPAEGSVPAQYYVIDPWEGDLTFTYNELRSGYWKGDAVWTHSIIRIAPSPDGCNRQFDPTCGCNGEPALPEAAEGTPAVPFGNFDPIVFANDVTEAGPRAGRLWYQSTPEATSPPAPWSADAAAMIGIAAQLQLPAPPQCAVVNATRAADGLDCCSPAADYTARYGLVPEAGVDAVTGASTVDPATATVPVRTCGQTPASWKVGGGLASMGVSGLHLSRPLTVDELRHELLNGRSVLSRGEIGSVYGGGLVDIQDWAPDEYGGDLFLVVRQGNAWKWVRYAEIIEGKSWLFGGWTDTWYRMTAPPAAPAP